MMPPHPTCELNEIFNKYLPVWLKKHGRAISMRVADCEATSVSTESTLKHVFCCSGGFAIFDASTYVGTHLKCKAVLSSLSTISVFKAFKAPSARRRTHSSAASGHVIRSSKPKSCRSSSLIIWPVCKTKSNSREALYLALMSNHLLCPYSFQYGADTCAHTC